MSDKVQKLLECYRKLKEEAAMAGGMTTQSTPSQPGFSSSASAEGPVAGYDQVDFRKRKYKPLNMFYRSSVKQLKTGAKNARKGNGKR